MVYLPVLIILGWLSYVDLKKREVPNVWVLTLFLYSILLVKNISEHAILAIFVFSLLFIVYLLSQNCIGGGDIRLLTVIAFLLGDSFTMFLLMMFPFLLLGFLIGVIIYRTFWFSVPLVPYIFLGFTGWYLFLS